jgi:CMP-N,N'-diacetyllegionaminic acid synthase
LKVERVSAIALIPVRGGSKGIPGKNAKLLGGHPLMSWPISIAASVGGIGRIIVSTEDSELAAIARAYGAEVDRRAEWLASDDALVFDVIIDLRDRLRAAGDAAPFMVLLEATSPFRTPEMISRALSLLHGGYDSVATFCASRCHPLQAWRISDQRVSTYIDGANPWVSRQSLPPAFQLTGELYAFRLDALDPAHPSLLVGKCFPMILEAESSVDINTPQELERARSMFNSSPLTSIVPSAK